MDYFGWLLFSTNGRIGRRAWWLGQIIAVIAVALLSMLLHVSIPHTLSWQMFSFHNLSIGAVLGVFFFWVHLALNIKRWHDLTRAGWWLILNYIPILGGIISIVVLGFYKGDVDDNEYGKAASTDFP